MYIAIKEHRSYYLTYRKQGKDKEKIKETISHKKIKGYQVKLVIEYIINFNSFNTWVRDPNNRL